MRVLLPCLALLLPVAAAADINGHWLRTAEDLRSSVIEIYRDGEVWNGRIVAMESPVFVEGERGPDGEVIDAELVGTPRSDRLNPDPERRDRPVLGLEIIRGFEQARDDRWDGARIYNPEDGKTYRCRARLRDGGRLLEIRGYIGTPLLGRTQTWERLASPDDAPW